MKKVFPSLLALVLLSATSYAQRTCGTMDHLQMQLQQDPGLADRMQQIETFTQNWIANHQGDNSRTVVTIPVVVHVVYKTSAQNISDAQVQAQIDQLNADYARTNSDAGNTPSDFLGVAANTDIQFCLAVRDPSGNTTTGIIHKSTTVTSFSDNDNVKKSAQGGDDAWDRDSYLNLWTCNLSGGLLGYAQFPGGPASTDGVVVLYSSVGSIAQPGTASPYNYGRSATHEIGHWLNCYHIWGDDGSSCSGTDYVADTPNQADENFGCPSFPHVSCSNGPDGDMFMNYMDYSDDGCMNIWTAGQADRMQALFDVGGSRYAILSSQGCVPVGGGTCAVPTSLSATSITSSSATLNWATASGATSYNVRYKESSSGTWTNTTSTSTSKAISGLSASTQYDFQVQSVCSGGSTSSYSSTTNFTTTSGGGGGCTENNEPTNNKKGKAVSITVGTDLQSQISNSTDKDWWKFSNTSGATNIQVNVTTLPLDYDVKLYSPSGTKLATSDNSGTTDEQINYNTSTVGTYKVKVYGYAGNFSTSACYTLTVNISNSPYRLMAGANVTNPEKPELKIYPNPASDNVTIAFDNDEKNEAVLNVYNVMGQLVYTTNFTATEGFNTLNLNVSGFAKGNYHAQIISEGDILSQGFVITR